MGKVIIESGLELMRNEILHKINVLVNKRIL